ncbi:MAG TPA: hypothetical protein VHY22_13405 [Chthoniobacteraceae bacterium]|jgi:hypothetical protein|nr:hypothetical protein [Chthoniobacteraceae bacterium]
MTHHPELCAGLAFAVCVFGPTALMWALIWLFSRWPETGGECEFDGDFDRKETKGRKGDKASRDALASIDGVILVFVAVVAFILCGLCGLCGYFLLR